MSVTLSWMNRIAEYLKQTPISGSISRKPREEETGPVPQNIPLRSSFDDPKVLNQRIQERSQPFIPDMTLGGEIEAYFGLHPNQVVDRFKKIVKSHSDAYNGFPISPSVALSMAVSQDLNEEAVDDSWFPSSASLDRILGGALRAGQAIGEFAQETARPFERGPIGAALMVAKNRAGLEEDIDELQLPSLVDPGEKVSGEHLTDPKNVASNLGQIGLEISGGSLAKAAKKKLTEKFGEAAVKKAGTTAAAGIAGVTGSDLAKQYQDGELTIDDAVEGAIFALSAKHVLTKGGAALGKTKAAQKIAEKLAQRTSNIKIERIGRAVGASVEDIAAAKARPKTGISRHFDDAVGRLTQEVQDTQEFFEAQAASGEGRATSIRETFASALKKGPFDQDTLKNWKVETPVNAEDVVRGQATLEAKGREVLDHLVSGEEDLFNATQKEFAEMAAGYDAMKATPGRALRIEREFVDDTVKTLKEIDEYTKSIDGPMTDGQRKWINDKIEALRQKQKTSISERVNPYIKMVEEYATAAKLTSPTTHLRNLVANTVTGVQRGLEESVLAILDKQPGRIRHILPKRSAWGSATRKFVNVLFDETQGSQFKEFGRRRFIPGRAGQIVRSPFRLLAAADDFAKTLLWDSEMHLMSYDQAVKEGFKGKAGITKRMTELLENPPKQFMERATNIAKEYTFQEKPSKAISAISRAIDGTPLGRLVIPFIETPTNIVKFYGRRSPLGVFSPRNWDDFAKGGRSRKEMYARMGVGIGLSAGAWGMVQNLKGQNRITGPVPEDAGEREVFFAQGKKPFSIKFGDRWVSYQGFQPAGLYITMAAALDDALERNDDEGVIDLFGAMTVTAAEAIKELPFVSGLNSLVQAIESPERKADVFLRRTISGFIPTGLKDITRWQDAIQRDPKTLIQEIEAGIPGLSKKVPSRIDILGKDAQRLGKLSNVQKENLLLDEMEDVGFFPNPPTKTRGGFKMSEEEFREFRKISGKDFEERALKVIGSDDYQNQPDEGKQALLEEALTDAREEAGRSFIFEKISEKPKELEQVYDLTVKEKKRQTQVVPVDKLYTSITERQDEYDISKEKLINQGNDEAAAGWAQYYELVETNLAAIDEAFRNRDNIIEDLKTVTKESYDQVLNDIKEEYPMFAEQFDVIPNDVLFATGKPYRTQKEIERKANDEEGFRKLRELGEWRERQNETLKQALTIARERAGNNSIAKRRISVIQKDIENQLSEKADERISKIQADHPNALRLQRQGGLSRKEDRPIIGEFARQMVETEGTTDRAEAWARYIYLTTQWQRKQLDIVAQVKQEQEIQSKTFGKAPSARTIAKRRTMPKRFRVTIDSDDPLVERVREMQREMIETLRENVPEFNRDWLYLMKLSAGKVIGEERFFDREAG